MLGLGASQGVKALKCTHLSVKHTLAGASPAVVARSLDALRESRRVGADVHTLSVGHTLAGASLASKGV
jgi:hypothetical protein